MNRMAGGTTRQLIIGQGQIGTAVQAVLRCPGIDVGDSIPKSDVIHICFPWFDGFVEEVKTYQKQTGAKLVIVHSTVPVGTCDPSEWVHSPCRGIHPHLEAGIRTFVKFFGGKDSRDAAYLFIKEGLECRWTDNAKDTEAMKLWDTEQYREAVLLEKRIYEYCKKHDLDFNIVYTMANETYNEGYEVLGHPEYKKYVLKHIEGPIGGHCVEANHGILQATGE